MEGEWQEAKKLWLVCFWDALGRLHLAVAYRLGVVGTG